MVFDVQVTLDDGSQAPLFAGDIVVDAACLTAELNTWKTWVIKCQSTSQATYITSIIPLTLTKSRAVSLRWGIDDGIKITWQVAEPYTLLSVRTEYQTITTSAAGYPFQLTFVDALYSLAVNSKITAHRGSLQTIVERIATANQMESVIEPTAQQQLLLVQSYTTDYVFLLRLIEAATTSSGFGSYYMFVEGGVFHFHTRTYQQQPLLLPYNITVGPGASDLITMDEAQEQASNGGNITQTVSYDPLTGNTVLLEADSALYTRFGHQLSQAPGSVLFNAHVGPNQQGWEQARTQAHYARARDSYERVSFALGSVTNVKPGGIVIPSFPNSTDPAGGPYFIERVISTLMGGTLTVACTAIRGELASSRPDATSLRDAGSGDAVSQPFEAPGKDPTFTSATTTASIGTGTTVPIKSGG